PKVLNEGISSCSSDVYSFGMVVWEVLTRELPWCGEARGQDIYRRVVIKGDRPEIPVRVANDISAVVRACWRAEPETRPKFYQIASTLNSRDAASLTS
ncbi:unnamed protein product, partial [Sphacelaria rigidula]